MNNLKIEIIGSSEDWKRLSGAWNDLLNKSGSNSIFLTWEWLYAWAASYLKENRHLFIIAVYNHDALIGIAPWYIHHTKYKLFSMRQIEFLGSPEAGSDYLDVIAKRGKEREIAARLYEFLFGEARSAWDSLLLTDIPSPSLFLLHFLNKIANAGKYAEIQQSSFCPVVSLSPSRKKFISSLSSNRREQFRRHLRLLKSHGKIEYRTFSGQEINRALSDLFTLYRDISGHYKQSLHQFIKHFVLHCNGRNWLQIDFLSVDGRNIAGLLHLRYNGELGMFLMAVDKAFNPKISIGSVILGLSIQRASEQGEGRYDFLKGHESYKFHWAHEGRASLSLFLAQRRLSSLIFSTERFIKYTGKMLLR